MAEAGSEDGAVLAAQLATARAQVRRSLLPVALAHALVAWVLVQQGMTGAALLWWCAVTAVNVARSAHGERHARTASLASQRAHMRRWLLLMGLLEPLPLLLCAFHGSLESQYLVTMILLGLTVGGVSNLAGQLNLYIGWALPLCLVLVGLWLARGDVEGVGIAALIVMLFGLLGTYVRDYGTLLRREHRLAEDLRRERDLATAAVHARSQFFMAASHDLRQPLSAIRWYGEAVAEHARLLHHNTLADIGAGLVRAVGRTEPMLAQYLEIGQLDAQNETVARPPPQTWVAVRPLLHSLCDEWQPEAQAQGLTLRLDADAQALAMQVAGDEAGLRRIFDNLIGNALKFTPAGTVSLCAEPVAGAAAAARMRLSVRDTGIGIDAAHLPRLFDDFYQVANAERSATRGVGLGLAIASRHARRLGTELHVQSRVGQGSCFWFDLPAMATPPSPPAHAPAPARPSAGPARALHLLLLDDDAQVRDALGQALHARGWSVAACADLQQALRASTGGRPIDAMVVDYRMAGSLTGPEAVQALRDSGCTAPALILTGEIDAERLASLRQQGWPVLLKPVSEALLVRQLLALVEAGQR